MPINETAMNISSATLKDRIIATEVAGEKNLYSNYPTLATDVWISKDSENISDLRENSRKESQ